MTRLSILPAWQNAHGDQRRSCGLLAEVEHSAETLTILAHLALELECKFD